MAYTVSGGLLLGSANAGLTLVPALFDTTGASAAGLFTTNIHEVQAGTGVYHFTLTVPDNHRGYVKFTSSAVFKAAIFINPDEVTNAYQRNLIADHVLTRDWSAVTLSPAARCLWQAARFLRNRWTMLAGVLSVKAEDDTTEAWNGAVTTDAAALPVVGSDPS